MRYLFFVKCPSNNQEKIHSFSFKLREKVLENNTNSGKVKYKIAVNLAVSTAEKYLSLELLQEIVWIMELLDLSKVICYNNPGDINFLFNRNLKTKKNSEVPKTGLQIIDSKKYTFCSNNPWKLKEKFETTITNSGFKV